MRKLTLLVLLLEDYLQHLFSTPYPKEIIYQIALLMKLTYEKIPRFDRKNYVEMSTSEVKLLKKVFASTKNEFVNIGFYRDRIQIANDEIKFTLPKGLCDTLYCLFNGIITNVKTKIINDILKSIDDSALLIIYIYDPAHITTTRYSCVNICSKSYYGNNMHEKIDVPALCGIKLF